MIMALQTAYIMQKMSSEIIYRQHCGGFAYSRIRAGHNSIDSSRPQRAGITAELGTMSVTEQVDALATLGSNPIKYLVVPRYLSLLLLCPS